MSEVWIVEEGGKRRPLGILVRVLCVAILCALFIVAACYLLIAPASSYVSVEVNGQYGIGVEELLSIAGIRPDTKWSGFDARAAGEKLRAHPLFASATVEKKFPDRVVIQVEERVPVALAVADFDGRSVPVEIDREGVVFRIGATEAAGNLPLLTGLNMTDLVAGSRLNEHLQPLLLQLEKLEQENPRLLSAVSEIRIEPKTYGSYDLVLFPVRTPVLVRTDKALNEDALRYIMLLLDVIQGLDIDVRELDIRAGTVAYQLGG